MIVCNSYPFDGWNLQPASKMWAGLLSPRSITQLKTKDAWPLFGNLAWAGRTLAHGCFASKQSWRLACPPHDRFIQEI